MSISLCDNFRPRYFEQKQSELKPLICKCCGGKINRATMTCDYCDTEYMGGPDQIRQIKQENEKIQAQLDSEKLYKAAMDAIKDYKNVAYAAFMTPNEARKAMGLGAVHAYDTAGCIIKEFAEPMSKAEYDAIEEKDPDMVYFITD